jgi:outer membrane receptor protein involved in Fe transport
MHHQLAPTRLFFKQAEDNFGNIILDNNGAPYIPNKNLKMTRSQHYVAAYDKSLGLHTRLKVEMYYQKLDRVPVSPTYGNYSILNYGANFDLVFPDTLVNEGTGENYGVELTLERFLNNGFYYLMTTSFYESKYTGANGIERSTAFNGNYTYNVLFGKEFRFGKNKEHKKAENSLVVDLKFTLNGGQRYIPIDLEASQIAGEAVYDYNNSFVPKLPDYFRTDLKIGYKRNEKKITQEWVLYFQNLTNQKNVFYRTYDAETATEKTYFQNGFLPVIQYRILF